MRILKKLFTIVLILMVVVACFNSTVYADSDERIPIDLTYEVEANEDGVTGTIVDVEINKGGNELIIPDTIDGLIIYN